MTDERPEPLPDDPDALREALPEVDDTDVLRRELRAVEAELDALTARRSGFDLRSEVSRVRGVVLAMLGRADDDAAGYDSEMLSGEELRERIARLQRRRGAVKRRLESLEE